MLKKLFMVMLAALVLFALPVGAQEEVLELDEVVVTASRYEESIMDTPVSIEVISQEEIEESNANNLADLLQFAGSVHIKDNGGLYAKKDVLIRGFRGDQVLILIDGQPYNNPNDGEVKLQQIPIELIKRVEVLKSPSSAIYGPNAMGGVINIITKDAKDISKTTLNLGLGSYNTKQLGISSSFTGDKSSFVFIYDDLYSDGHRENSKIDREDFFAKYKYLLSETTDIKVAFKYNDSYIEYPGTTIFQSNGIMDDIDRNINFVLNQNFEEKDRQISLFNNNRDLYAITYGFTDYITDTNINSYGLSYQENLYLKNHTVSYGLDLTKNEVEAKINYFDYGIFAYTEDNYNKDNLNKAVFIQDKYNYNEKNIFSYGLRYDDHDEYGSELSPKFGYIYKINDNLNFNFAASQSFRAPSFYELYGTYGNLDLKPEKTDSFDLGFKYFDDVCSREISIFKRDVKDLIVTDYVNEINLNEESADITGFEISSNRTFNNKFEFGFNYTYLKAEDVNGEQLIDMPNHEMSLNLHYLLENARISLFNRYVGERRDVLNVPPYDAPESSSFFVSDFKVTSNLTADTEISVEINNLFDREYEVVNDYPMPGRNFMVNLSTKF
jgi:outer membrane receptor for ferrienterochelin and colicins